MGGSRLKTPSCDDLLALVPRIDPAYKPVWDGKPAEYQAALAGYFLPHRSKKDLVCPTRPKIIKWYCPFASQSRFPSGHRYCINVYVGCGHRCSYCYAAGYEPDKVNRKREFERWIDRDLEDLDRFDVPPAPVHLSNSTDPFQPIEKQTRHTKHALERILSHRRRFTTVTVLTKNPLLPVEQDYIDLFKALNSLPRDHPSHDTFARHRLPAFQIHVSLAFWSEEAGMSYDGDAPSVADRLAGVRTLRDAGIPVVLRIDPLFPRSPLPTRPSKTLQDFGIPEAQTMDDLASLVSFAKGVSVRHVVYNTAKLVPPRGRKLDHTVKGMLRVYQALAAPDKLTWRGGSWRLPEGISRQHIVVPFLDVCKRAGVEAKFCMKDLLETP
jgi:DNA repair photolyase